MLEGRTANSALEFRIQPHELKLDKSYNSSNHNALTDGTFLSHVVNDSVPDELYSSDYSEDDHKESIIWKGALGSSTLKDRCLSEETGLDDCYVSDYYDQEELSIQKNDQIALWANTWPRDREEDDTLDSLSSLQTDSDGQVDGGSPLWSDAGLYKSFEQKENRQIPVTNTDIYCTATNLSSLLDNVKLSSWGNDIDQEKLCKGSKKFTGFDPPECDDNWEFFAWEGNMSERGGTMPTFAQHIVSVGDCVKDDDCKRVCCLSPNKSVDFAMHEGFLKPSRYIIDTEDLDRLISESKCHKESVKKGTEEIYLLRQKVEQEELVARQAMAGAKRGVEEFLCKVEDIRQQTLHKRAQYNMQAAEVYGEKSVLSMEAQELRSQLLATQAEQARAMSLLDSIRCTLGERLQKASQEKDLAVQEAKLREEIAKQLLAYEEDSAQKLSEDVKALETEAEMCTNLREFLIQRGHLIDSLQGEMLVLCEDILKFKKQVDDGIPLSASRCLTYDHLSHKTQQSLSMSPFVNANDRKTSNLVEILTGTSNVTLSSAVSGPHFSVGALYCTMHSQSFSSNTASIETLDAANEDGLNEEELTIVADNSCDYGRSRHPSREDLNAASIVVLTATMASP